MAFCVPAGRNTVGRKQEENWHYKAKTVQATFLGVGLVGGAASRFFVNVGFFHKVHFLGF